MRKGLTLTLTTVAIAMISVQARAMAPTISDIPSPIVGNAEPVTGAAQFGNFVYLDAIDLNTMATDDQTAPSNLMWTYTGSGTNGASNYLINGVQPINVGTTDPTSPTTSMIINRNDLDPVPGKDSAKNTITIRNQALSPLPMTKAGTDPGATAGIIAAQTQPVMFFCSDGNAYSSQTVFFYSDNNGSDRLSGGDPFKVEKTDKITTPWAQNPSEWIAGGITRTTAAGGGVCLNGSLTGSNYGSVISSFPYFNMAANQVYRIKLKMTSSQATPLTTMFWDMVLENYVPDTGKGENLYIMDTLIFPNEGGANSLTTAGGTYTLYWTPPAVATPQWNNATTGAFISAYDATNDPRLRFRLMDVDGVAGAQNESKTGSVCLNEVEIASASVTRAQVATNLVNITSLAPNTGAGGNVEYNQIAPGYSTAAFSGGALTLTPSAAAALAESAEVRPATDTNYGADPSSTSYQDNFPIAWKTGKLLRLQIGLSAPTAADEAHPYDAYVFLFNTMTNEINMESYQTSNHGIGSPKAGTPQTYTAFFYTNNETASTSPAYHRLRWIFRAMNGQTANFPTPADTTNTGSVKISSIKVDEVVFK